MNSPTALPATFDGVIANFILNVGMHDVTHIRQNDWVVIRGKKYFAELECVIGQDPHLGFFKSPPDDLEAAESHDCALWLTRTLVESARILQMEPVHA